MDGGGICWLYLFMYKEKPIVYTDLWKTILIKLSANLSLVSAPHYSSTIVWCFVSLYFLLLCYPFCSFPADAVFIALWNVILQLFFVVLKKNLLQARVFYCVWLLVWFPNLALESSLQLENLGKNLFVHVLMAWGIIEVFFLFLAGGFLSSILRCFLHK